MKRKEDMKYFDVLSNVTPKRIDWFFEPFIPYGMLTILEGDPDQGKSFLGYHFAAKKSAGGKLPNGHLLTAGNALILAAEDDATYTVRPRIDAMGGDPTRIRFMNIYMALDDEGFALLEKEVKEFRPAYIFADPVYSFIPGSVNLFQSNQIRAFLVRLGELAKIVPSALVVVRHLRKAGGEKQLYAGSGSIDVIAVARSAIRVFPDPEDPDLRVFAHLKHNLSEEGKSWLYRLDKGGDDEIPRVEWMGQTELRAADADREGDTEKKKAKLEEAVEFLRRELEKGARPSAAIQSKAEHYGHASRTLVRAKEEIGVVVEKKLGAWFWSLPTKAASK